MIPVIPLSGCLHSPNYFRHLSLQEAFKAEISASGPQFEHVCQFCGFGCNTQWTLLSHLVKKHAIHGIPVWGSTIPDGEQLQSYMSTGQWCTVVIPRKVSVRGTRCLGWMSKDLSHGSGALMTLL